MLKILILSVAQLSCCICFVLTKFVFVNLYKVVPVCICAIVMPLLVIHFEMCCPKLSEYFLYPIVVNCCLRVSFFRSIVGRYCLTYCTSWSSYKIDWQKKLFWILLCTWSWLLKSISGLRYVLKLSENTS